MNLDEIIKSFEYVMEHIRKRGDCSSIMFDYQRYRKENDNIFINEGDMIVEGNFLYITFTPNKIPKIFKVFVRDNKLVFTYEDGNTLYGTKTRELELPFKVIEVVSNKVNNGVIDIKVKIKKGDCDDDSNKSE